MAAQTVRIFMPNLFLYLDFLVDFFLEPHIPKTSYLRIEGALVNQVFLHG